MSTADGGHDDKPKEDRLKEGITILQKLREVGITDVEPGFREIQNYIRVWVAGGPAAQHRIEFPRYGRVAELLLPRRARNVASMSLKSLA
jgi:hypothetical protein